MAYPVIDGVNLFDCYLDLASVKSPLDIFSQFNLFDGLHRLHVCFLGELGSGITITFHGEVVKDDGVKVTKASVLAPARYMNARDRFVRDTIEMTFEQHQKSEASKCVVLGMDFYERFPLMERSS